MAVLSVIAGSAAAAEDTAAIHTTLQHPLGTKAVDPDGNEYIYLQGVASTAAGDWVVFDENHLTARTTTTTIFGPIAIAMAAVVASSYGWYQIRGKNTTANVGTSFADNGDCYVTATAGRADDAGAAGDQISGAYGRSAETSNVATVQLFYPNLTGGLG